MNAQVCAFTDTYLPTVNGVTYTIKSWHDGWCSNGGAMDVVYPSSNGFEPTEDEHPVRSVSFPFYDGYRLGLPVIPDEVEDGDIVHAHTPFSLGLAALRQARRTDAPLIASYHTPTGEYTTYLAPFDPLARSLSRVSLRYERWFLNRADVVTAPTETTANYLTETVGIDHDVHVVSNGVDLSMFAPTDPGEFIEHHDLPERPRIGYTGRHGYEKNLEEMLHAVANGPKEWSLVIAGEGPATDDLIDLAGDLDIDVTFLGFLDREELPSFYASLDVFAFPSPIETQGLVALEAIACGTPVVAVNGGALVETIEDGITGYHYDLGDIDSFTASIERTLDERDTLSEQCLSHREEISLEQSIESLQLAYEAALNGTTG